MPKALTAIVAVVLLLMMTVGAAGLAYVFISDLQQSGQESAQGQLGSMQEAISACMTIDSIYSNKVYLRNCGDGIIDNASLRVYMDEKPINISMSPPKLEKNGAGTISLYGIWDLAPYTNHNLKLQNDATSVSKRVLAEPRKEDLVGGWDFDDGSGTVARDWSGKGNGGTLTNGTITCSGGGCPEWVEGKFGKAIKFDGQNDSVKIPFTMTNFSFQTIHGPSTLSLWSKADSLSGTTRIFSDNCFEWGLYISGSTIYGAAYSGVNGGTIAANEWHNFAVVHEHPTGLTNTLIKLYVDGNFKGQSTLTITTQNGYADSPYGIGADGCYGASSSSFNGTIDDVRIYNKALAPDELVNLKAA